MQRMFGRRREYHALRAYPKGSALLHNKTRITLRLKGEVIMSFITVKDVRKSFGSGDSMTNVLKGVSVDIAKGEMCGIFGPSGSGKSTLLNMIGGLEDFNSGSITVDGAELSGMKNKAAVEYRRKNLSFIFQFYNLVPDLTIRENIRAAEYLSKEPLPIDELIETVGLKEHQHKYPSQVSGGQQQRCAIARAIVKNPKVMLCDEPTGALDFASSRIVLELLERVNRQYGTTMLIVTHNEAIRLMVDHIVKVHDGLIAEDSFNKNKLSASEIDW